MTDKYEFYLLMTNSESINEKSSKLQADGWILSGDVLIKTQTGNCTDIWAHVPFKRKIK